MLSRIYCLNLFAYLKNIGLLSKQLYISQLYITTIYHNYISQLYIQWMSLHKIHRITCYKQEFDEIL